MTRSCFISVGRKSGEIGHPAAAIQIFLLGVDGALGTISSSAGLTAMYRYGRQLQHSFTTALLTTSRASNPVAVRSGWFMFAGVNARYLANQIFLDGNTFDNDGQESMEYDNEAVGVTVGVTYCTGVYAMRESCSETVTSSEHTT